MAAAGGSQPLAFGELLAGGVLLTAGITGHSIRDVLAGRSSPIKPLATDFPTGATGGSQNVSNPTDTGALPGDVKGLKKLQGVGNFEGKKVALWIIPILTYARKKGWKGTVTSGYRSTAEQAAIYNSGVRPAAPPGSSNHEGDAWPRGAVDVTDAEGLSRILKASPFGKLLIWAGAKDPVHFSFPHDGSY